MSPGSRKGKKAREKAPKATSPAGAPAPPHVDVDPTWLAEQRWFGAKGSATSVHDAAATEVAEGLTVTLVTTAGPDGLPGDRYQLVGPAPGADAAATPETGARLTSAFRDATTTAGPAGTVRFMWLADAHPLPEAGARPLGAEQSNTSLVLGERYVLKVLRRVQPGENPELEVLRHLQRTGFAHVPALAGWCELDEAGRAGDGPTTLAIATELVPGARDGWDHVVAELGAGRGGAVLPLVHELGSVLAGLHRALADHRDDPAFTPVDGGKALAAAVARSVADHAAEVLPRLAGRDDLGGGDDLAGLDGAAGAVADLAHHLAERLDAGPALRHHGDLHLGQTLLGTDGWVFIDFEGEPARDLAARRAPHSPLRDVAGMLRSFSYAAATDAAAGGRTGPGWEAAARAALLDGYLPAVGQDLLPPGPVATARLLALLELEKAVYEVGYELDHRPDWVPIPARALHRLLGGNL